MEAEDEEEEEREEEMPQCGEWSDDRSTWDR